MEQKLKLLSMEKLTISVPKVVANHLRKTPKNFSTRNLQKRKACGAGISRDWKKPPVASRLNATKAQVMRKEHHDGHNSNFVLASR
jgi:hypothetical protein